MNTLIVDDEPLARRELRRLLAAFPGSSRRRGRPRRRGQPARGGPRSGAGVSRHPDARRHRASTCWLGWTVRRTWSSPRPTTHMPSRLRGERARLPAQAHRARAPGRGAGACAPARPGPCRPARTRTALRARWRALLARAAPPGTAHRLEGNYAACTGAPAAARPLARRWRRGSIRRASFAPAASTSSTWTS